MEDVYRQLKAAPKPLAAYLFTKSKVRAREGERRISAGSLCVNDTISQIMPAELPMGGVGDSGYGRYRGRAGFDRFSNPKSVLRRRFFMDLPFRYPPYKTKISHLKKAFRWLMD